VRKRVAWITIVTLSACGASEHGPDPTPGALPSGPCSELARAVYRSRGQENEACGPALTEQRELLAIGDGYVLEWNPTSGRHRIWAVEDEAPLGSGPLMTGLSAIRQGQTLHALGGRRVITSELLRTGWRIYAVDVNMRGSFGETAISPLAADGTWGDPFWGHDLVALDDDYVLRWWSGTGEYVVLQYDRQAEKLPATAFHGTLEGLRRGARLVNLGAHRLLEWIPLTGDYRIWAYRFDRDTSDIFEMRPVSEGTWRDVRGRQEILVVDQSPDAGRILVWNRDDGHVVLRAFDPVAADPLAGRAISEASYQSLESPFWDAPAKSNVQNVVIFLQRGRSFDSYFGRYCRGVDGATCDQGPDCCEAMPASIPGATDCAVLEANADNHAPAETTACLTAKIDGGSMNGYATAPGCGSALDFACAGTDAAAGAVARYHRLAEEGALGDRFFQTTIDGDAFNAELNLIYLSKAAYGTAVSAEGGLDQLTFLLSQAGVRYALYVADPQDVGRHYGQSPPLFYDPHWTTFRGISELERDIALEQLPAISIVLAPPGLDEQPGSGPAADGIDFVTGLADRLATSARYQPTTLVLLTYLTSGGYYDHVSPPPPPPVSVDATATGAPIPHGPRVPILAIGRFVRPGHVSHTPMEISSLVAFLEWNWLDGAVGQLGRRDTVVANLGSLLDGRQTGVQVP
jgi:hypothetical protein